MNQNNLWKLAVVVLVLLWSFLQINPPVGRKLGEVVQEQAAVEDSVIDKAPEAFVRAFGPHIVARGGELPRPSGSGGTAAAEPFGRSVGAPADAGHGGPEFAPGEAEQELANRVPKITADQFFKILHDGTSQPYVITYDNQRAVFKPESQIVGDGAWVGDDLYRRAS